MPLCIGLFAWYGGHKKKPSSSEAIASDESILQAIACNDRIGESRSLRLTRVFCFCEKPFFLSVICTIVIPIASFFPKITRKLMR